MRARLALVRILEETGRSGEAIDHYRDLLRLNRNDSHGVRYLLLPLLLEQGRDEEAGHLLAEYEDQRQAISPYARALWTFRREGDSPAARAALGDATRINRHVIRYLLDPDSIPWPAPYFALGSKEEAGYAADALCDAYERTDDALGWIDTHASDRRASRRKR